MTMELDAHLPEEGTQIVRSPFAELPRACAEEAFDDEPTLTDHRPRTRTDDDAP